MRDLSRGAQLANRYTLVRNLGSGSDTQTWLADDRLTGTSVALKIQTDATQNAEVLRREWRVNIRLMHAHIVRAFEFHDDPEGAFYAMQFVAGPNIGVLTGAALSDVLPAIASLASAILYTHDKEVVHRDLKASNVLLDSNGAPYLIDFGVAATHGNNIGGGSLIAASPQVLDGLAPQASDDIFALGGLIYELVSGHSPYSSSDTESDIRHRVPPDLTEPNGTEVPAPIRNLVATMLDKDASRRPDAATVVAELEASGFKAGVVPQKFVASVGATRDEVIESESIQRGKQKTKTALSPASEKAGRGLSTRVVAIGLALLLALLLGVIFVLPGTVTQQSEDLVVDEVPGGDEASTDGDPADSGELPQRDERVQARSETDEILGGLLSTVRTLEGRAVERWGGIPYKRAQEAYAAGDEAYLARDYVLAGEKYKQAAALFEPLLSQVEAEFQTAFDAGQVALENAETADAVRHFELAVAISPSHGPARAGLSRAKNLDTVLSLTEQGLVHERELELDAAKQSFERAIEIDPQWEVASVGLERVLGTINQMQFDARMTEGLSALADREYLSARAAFRMAKVLQPDSPEPADGLLQVDQGLRLGNIAALERQAKALESDERWSDAADAYKNILELDANLTFAQDGLARANQMSALHTKIDGYIADPDSLSSPRTMQVATNLVVNITRMESIGPRLAEQRDQLSSLLKRAATPLSIQIVSDNVTDVSIYKVAKLGTFAATELTLRPGTYVAVGSRPGYRDVRLEFRVAPEIDMPPVVVRCEEKI